MRKTAVCTFAAVLLGMADLFAQPPAASQPAPPPASEIRQQATEMGQAARDEFEQKQFAGQVRKLRDGLAKGDFNKVAALQSTLLNAMRREIGQARANISSEKKDGTNPETKPATDARPVEKSRADKLAEGADLEEKQGQLARMELILAENQNFTFKNDNREASEAKLKLIEEFGDILQKDIVDVHRKMGAGKTGDGH